MSEPLPGTEVEARERLERKVAALAAEARDLSERLDAMAQVLAETAVLALELRVNGGRPMKVEEFAAKLQAIARIAPDYRLGDQPAGETAPEVRP